MNKQRTMLSIGMIIGAGLLLTSLFQLEAFSDDQPQVEVKKTITQEISAAKKLVKERNRLGKKFIKVFVDKKQPMALRHNATFMLGKLQYFPAIDTLILHVNEVGNPDITSEIPEQTPVSALYAFGFGASPQVVDYVLKGRKGYSLPSFHYVRTANYVKSYCNGLEQPHPKDWKRASGLGMIRRLIPGVHYINHTLLDTKYPVVPRYVKFAKFVPQTDAQKIIVKEIEAANKLADERERLGKLLTNFFKDSKQPAEQRIATALLLGEMQYFPAISILVKNIHLQPSKTKKALPAPLSQALAHFGNAAVPAIVDECLKNPRIVISKGLLKGKSVASLYQSIRAGKTIDVARTYAKGIAVEKPDSKTRKKVKAFLNGLTEIEKS